MHEARHAHHRLLERAQSRRAAGSLPGTPISATPIAELNSTTAGTIALASAWNGFGGDVQVGERERLARLDAARALKNDALSTAAERPAA